MEVVESVQEAPEPQVIVNENAQSAFENVALPTYEEMMFQDWLVCGNVEPPLDLPADLEQVALQEYLLDASKPLHTLFFPIKESDQPALCTLAMRTTSRQC